MTHPCARHSEIEALRAEMTALRADVTAVRERVDALEDIDDRVDEHDRQLDEIRRDLRQMRGAVDRVLSASSEQMKELKVHGRALDGQRVVMERVAGLLEQLVRQQTPTVVVAS